MDPHDVFEQMRQSMLSGTVNGELLTDDIVLEWPFAAPGRPKRIEGKQAFLAMAGPARDGLPFHIDQCTLGALHQTAHPDVVVLEYELGGTVTATGERRSAAVISVIRTRDGQIAGWREYQDTFAIAQALAQSGTP